MVGFLMIKFQSYLKPYFRNFVVTITTPTIRTFSTFFARFFFNPLEIQRSLLLLRPPNVTFFPNFLTELSFSLFVRKQGQEIDAHLPPSSRTFLESRKAKCEFFWAIPFSACMKCPVLHYNMRNMGIGCPISMIISLPFIDSLSSSFEWKYRLLYCLQRMQKRPAFPNLIIHADIRTRAWVMWVSSYRRGLSADAVFERNVN